MSESRRIRVLVVDDHALVRQGIIALLGGYPNIEVVGEAADGASAISAFPRTRPDVTLMDLRMPASPVGGVEVIATIRRETPDARFIVLTTYDGDEDIHHAMRAGARAYLLKDVSRQTLLETIQAVDAGQTVVPAELAARLERRDPSCELTVRERDVLELVVKGMTNKEIAATLAIAPSTVKKHVNKVLLKLGVKSREQAIVAALEQGLATLVR